MSYHIDNLKKNNVGFSLNKIKYYLQKFREEMYPRDDDFLNAINLIKITFDHNTDELKDLLFCYLNESYINPLKNNRTEKIVLFTSEVQIKKLEFANQIFMDSTFRSCPKDYYQVFNILADFRAGKIIFRFFHILMSNKSSYAYHTIFYHINN